VIHNAGGRDIDAVINDIASTGYGARTMIPDRPPFEVAVVHHAGCGTRFLTGAAFHPPLPHATGPGKAVLAADAGRRPGGHRPHRREAAAVIT
jgi:hypothetical protein